ncbi:MAG TPA: trypsin-like serine peptidase [Candidatus Wujingus californicus]|nr:trypsin-like peptidase domain-containing protein [Planctomycetota bacterium]
MRKCHIGLVAILLSIMCTEAGAQEINKNTAFFNQQWLKALVSLEVLDSQGKGTSIGTGFLIGTPSNHIALVTAKHVVYENEGNGALLQNIAYRLNRTDGESILIPDGYATAQLKSGWYRSETNDVACRLVVLGNTSDFMTIPYSLFLPTRQIQAAAPLFIIGFPMGLRSEKYATPIVRRASIARVDTDMFIVDGFVYPGNSGGPVIYEPNIQVGTGLTTTILQRSWLAGMVLSEISYIEPAISLQTKRARVTFEQNSGLSNVLPSDKIMELLHDPAFVKSDEALR